MTPPIIILVEPQLVENIGTTARAMMNCGLNELRIVDPRDKWPLGEVHQNRMANASSGADKILKDAKSFCNSAIVCWRSLSLIIIPALVFRYTHNSKPKIATCLDNLNKLF